MNEEQKQKYLTKYYQLKQKGVRFYPDIVYKDLLVSFAIFLLLVGLATFIGVANEPKADPSDTAYIPRPEWYFLFLFQMLKYFPGKLEWVGTAVIPGAAVLTLFLLPFLDRNPRRYWKQRKHHCGWHCSANRPGRRHYTSPNRERYGGRYTQRTDRCRARPFFNPLCGMSRT
jgi:quinol-cytochrome oxidoreductase complex cytochrome b subunit